MSFIHPLSDVAAADIGEGTRVWQYAVVLKNARIGKDCNICSHTLIEGDVIVGDRVTVKSGVFIWDGTRVEDDVFIGAGTLVPPNKILKSGYLYKGNPAQQARPLKESEVAFLKQSALNYIKLKDEYIEESN